MGAMFVGETEIGDAEGIHLRRKPGSALLGRFEDLSELDVAGLPDGGEQGGLIFEVRVGGRARNPQPLADFAQGESGNPLLFD